MKIISCILLLNSYFLFSQSLESIKNKDTLYILFDSKQNQQKIELGKTGTSDEKSVLYRFSTDHHNISFFYDKYLNFDDIETDKRASVELHDSQFITANKDKILTIDFFEKNGFRQAYYGIFKKHIFLADIADKKDGKYIFREVFIKSSFEEM